MMPFSSIAPDKIIKIYFKGSFLMSWQEKFNVITVCMKLGNESFLMWKMGLSISVKRIKESLVKTNDLICLNYSSNCCRCSSINIHTSFYLSINIFFPSHYLGVKQRNLTKTGIFLPVKENYLGRRKFSQEFFLFVFFKDCGRELELLICALLFNETFQSLIRPEKCRPVRITLELIPQRTGTDTDCPLWGRFVLVHQFLVTSCIWDVSKKTAFIWRRKMVEKCKNKCCYICCWFCLIIGTKMFFVPENLSNLSKDSFFNVMLLPPSYSPPALSWSTSSFWLLSFSSSSEMPKEMNPTVAHRSVGAKSQWSPVIGLPIGLVELKLLINMNGLTGL